MRAQTQEPRPSSEVLVYMNCPCRAESSFSLGTKARQIRIDWESSVEESIASHMKSVPLDEDVSVVVQVV